MHLWRSDAISSFRNEVSQDLVCHSLPPASLLYCLRALQSCTLTVSQCGRASDSREGTIGYPEWDAWGELYLVTDIDRNGHDVVIIQADHPVVSCIIINSIQIVHPFLSVPGMSWPPALPLVCHWSDGKLGSQLSLRHWPWTVSILWIRG